MLFPIFYVLTVLFTTYALFLTQSSFAWGGSIAYSPSIHSCTHKFYSYPLCKWFTNGSLQKFKAIKEFPHHSSPWKLWEFLGVIIPHSVVLHPLHGFLEGLKNTHVPIKWASAAVDAFTAIEQITKLALFDHPAPCFHQPLHRCVLHHHLCCSSLANLQVAGHHFHAQRVHSRFIPTQSSKTYYQI